MAKRVDKRRAQRRAAHQAQRRSDVPALVLEQETFSVVKKSHIVPEMFQKAWAVDGQVEVHVLEVDGRPLRTVPMSIGDAATRPRFYRRVRPDGTDIDDTEASLAYVETKTEPVLSRALSAASALPLDAKGGLAQFIGVQMIRGPRFFEQRRELLESMIRDVPHDQFKPAAIRAAKGDVRRARHRLLEVYAAPTQAHLTLLATAVKLGMILSNMRWELLRFDEPLLAYSDHPVYVWPGFDQFAAPAARQTLGPLEAAEVIVPLGPQTLLVANWLDLPDPPPRRAGATTAGDANALVLGQADRQWMHRRGSTPPITDQPVPPITPRRHPGYDARAVAASRRRVFAAEELARNRHRTHLRELRALELGLP